MSGAFFANYCLDCHQGAEAEAGLALDELDPESGSDDVLARWRKVHTVLKAGQMPPAYMPQPKPERVERVLDGIVGRLTEASAARQREHGRVRLRRLNRVEYEYTLRDLLELPHLQVKEMLPLDSEAHGFDNVGAALRISYVQMGRYLDAAEEALSRAAWLAPEPRQYAFRLPFPEIHRFRITKDRTTIGDEAVLLRQPNTAQTPWRIDGVAIPFPGRHTIRIRGRAVTYVQEKEDEVGEGDLLPPEAPHVVSVYQGTRLLGSFDLTEEPATREVTAHLDAGEQLVLYVPTLDDWNPKWTKGAYTGPAVALEWFELEGPADTTWPRSSYKVLFGDLPVEQWTEDSGFDPPAELGELKHPKRYPKIELPDRRNRYMVVSDEPIADARRLLERFMTRAFRRPVPEGEVDRYLPLVREQLETNKPFHEALLTGYKAVLCSPDFLYFYEERPGELDEYALASRLSYFLWRSMPDDELRSLADRGVLHDEDVLSEQVERLLDDPRSERFVEDFAGQWLDLRELHVTEPDEGLYPEFDQFLLESMRAETLVFVRAMLERDLPARSVIDADFAIVNNALADLYDIEGVEGVALREVTLPEESPRGGLMTQASILKVTADGSNTSPVKRGVWVLDRLLGDPPPPPPPDVPAIEPDTRGTNTIRDLLAAHRADPSCASCHSKIDPPGFALERFDVVGGWRDRYRSMDAGERPDLVVDSRPVRYKLHQDVDPSGEWADGRPFADIHDFKALLLEQERQIARNLAERLVVFGTGAEVSFADQAAVERILDRAEDDRYGLRTLILEVVQSELFRRK